ncbi:hypothetical protein ACFRQM_40440, partial [Streptomyces sp. NPDC056831]
ARLLAGRGLRRAVPGWDPDALELGRQVRGDGAKYGAFHRKGDLQDTSAGDGRNVRVQVKVEGYSWNRCPWP